MNHPTVKRARITVDSLDLACKVRRAIGWTSVCPCGEHLPIRHDRADAARDALEHAAGCIVPRPGSRPV